MPLIELTTLIHAPLQRCFDLSRSINVHLQSFAHTHETAIAGVQSGFIKAGETVTWRAKHLGFYFTMTVAITAMDAPVSFTDEMLSGPFAAMRHDHYFAMDGNICVMRCHFFYRSPFGIIGQLADILFLKNYMRGLLLKRNREIKRLAEQ